MWLLLQNVLYSAGFCFTARVIMDRETGRSRGFGFVSYDSSESASEAQSAMDGQVRNRMFLRELISLITELCIDWSCLFCRSWVEEMFACPLLRKGADHHDLTMTITKGIEVMIIEVDELQLYALPRP